MLVLGIVVIAFVIGFISCILLVVRHSDYYRRSLKTQNMLYATVYHYLNNKCQGKGVIDYLKSYGYKKVVIYGAGDLGKIVYEDLREEDSIELFIVDKRADDIIVDCPVFGLDNNIPQADVMIVTPMQYYDEIKNNMELKITYPIVSLYTIVNSL